MDITVILPEECISHIIALTSPRDAGRLSVVSPVFKSVADSDAIWERFLPSDYQEIVSNSVSSASLLTSLSKKDLYFHLCHNPILLRNGTMSFALEKESGKKCFMIGAREFDIAWGNAVDHWIWPSLPESRFGEVAKLEYVWQFEIKGRVESKIFSTKTNYAAYLVFKFDENRYGFDKRPVNFEVYFEGSDNRAKRRAFLDPLANVPPQPQDRGHGWMEVEMGEFFIENGDDGKLMFRGFECDGYSCKEGILIQGIEFRPKSI